MTAATLRVPFRDREYDLLNAASVGELLRLALPDKWMDGGAAEVRVERCFPIGAPEVTGFLFEWSFAAKNRRFTIYGHWGAHRPRLRRNGKGVAPVEPMIKKDGIRGLLLHLEEPQLTLRSPDQDEGLPQVSICLDGRRMAPRLVAFGQRECAMPQAAARLKCRLGAYRPGRRATIRFAVSGLQADRAHLCGKTFRDDRGKRLLQLHLRTSAELRQHCGGRIRVPSPVGFDDDLRLALFVWMPGRGLAGDNTPGDEALTTAVEALAAIHNLPAHGRETFGPADECAIVARWRNVVQQVMPASAEEGAALAARLSTAARDLAPFEPTTIHRDFYEKQLIISPQCVTVLDLDTMACGDVCVDLGNFLAHLLLRQTVSAGSCGGFEVMAGQLLQKYEARRAEVNRRNLTFYTASSLFRLGALHGLRTSTARHRPALWTMVDYLLNRGALDVKPSSSPFATRSWAEKARLR